MTRSGSFRKFDFARFCSIAVLFGLTFFLGVVLHFLEQEEKIFLIDGTINNY